MTEKPSTFRQLKATIIGDLVGYSRLVGDDDVGTVDRLADLRRKHIEPQVVKCGGWMRWSAGDQMIAVFDSVVDAVECAYQIQCELETTDADIPDIERIRMRIGISFGDIIVKSDDIAGDSVNIAARLESLCEPGGIALSEAAYTEVHQKIRLHYEEYGLYQLKNIADPVRVYRVRARDMGRRDDPTVNIQTRSRRVFRRILRDKRAVMVVVSLGAALGLTLLFDQFGFRDPPAVVGTVEGNAIAVLPFENLSNDPKQEHIARGIATDLIIDLSGIKTASIVARNSSFQYVKRPIKLNEVVSLLGAKFVVDGTVLRESDSIRVNVLLIDAPAQRQIWAARFDGKTSELFTFQKKIANKLLAAIKGKIADATLPAPRPRENFAETEMFYKAREAYYKDNPAALANAASLLNQILRENANFYEAHAYLAAIYWAGFDEDWSKKLGLSSEQSLDLAWQHLNKSLKTPVPLTYQVQSRILAWEGEHEQALKAAENAISLDSNDPVGRLTMGIALIYSGRMNEALAFVESAGDADPLNLADYRFWEGLAKYLLGDYAGAEESLRKSVDINKGDDWAHLALAAAYGQQGRIGDAKDEIETVQALRQDSGNSPYTLRFVRYWTFKRTADITHLCEGLAKAGLKGKCN